MSGGREPDAVAANSQRLDKWLWFARLIKSRTLAATMITGGKIRVNRMRVAKASQLVKPGDVITSAAQRQIRVVRVKAAGTRRGPPLEAQALYEELTQPFEQPKPISSRSPREQAQGPIACRPYGAGRPTKRDRRQTDFLKGRDV